MALHTAYLCECNIVKWKPLVFHYWAKPSVTRRVKKVRSSVKKLQFYII